jgi:ribosomal protein S4
MVSSYGKGVKKFFFANSNLGFNIKFFNFLIFLETRLNIILLRMGFFKKLLEGNDYIKKKLILVNGKNKNKNYLIRKGDLIHCITLFSGIKGRTRFLN